ncbi:MAG TPA: cytochrome c [Casimicrobiaceae bacterium]|nr:cytochrome c [Casimicrobiaceae bacterium]
MNARLLLLSLLAPLPALAQQPAPFVHGDADAGRVLVERDCVVCHAQRYDPASAMYTRKDRRVTSAPRLLAQVQRCNVELGAGYFPEEEENVAAYLNRAYYKFAP